MTLDPYEAREVTAPDPYDGPDVQLVGLPAIGGGMVQGPTDDEPWRPSGYVPESGTAVILTVDDHPVGLPDPGLAARLASIEARLAALEA